MSRAQDILEQIYDLDEAGAKLTLRIRKGKVQRKLVCPPFFKKTGMACLKLTASDARKLTKMRKKQFKKKMRQKLNTILKKRARSMGIRQSVVGDVAIDDKGSADDKSK
jgi:hypothetical protein